VIEELRAVGFTDDRIAKTLARLAGNLSDRMRGPAASEGRFRELKCKWKWSWKGKEAGPGRVRGGLVQTGMGRLGRWQVEARGAVPGLFLPQSPKQTIPISAPFATSYLSPSPGGNRCGDCCDPATLGERLKNYLEAGTSFQVIDGFELWDMGVCSHFKRDLGPGGKGGCSIYPTRPHVCRIFPNGPLDTVALPRCGYRFIWVPFRESKSSSPPRLQVVRQRHVRHLQNCRYPTQSVPIDSFLS